MLVDYAVTVAVDGAGVSNEQLDYLTLQSNRVENSYRTLAGRPTPVHVAASFATEALQDAEPQSGRLTVHEDGDTRGSVTVFVDKRHSCNATEETLR